MQHWNSLEQARRAGPCRGGALAIGVFDGVHRGHAQLLQAARRVAGGHSAVAVTFFPHPAAVLRPEAAPPLLATLDRRLELLAEHGMDATLVLPFTRQLADWTPEEFVERLVDALGPHSVVVGEDFRFGARAAGDVELLRRLGERSGFAVTSVPAVTDAGRRISSSAVRELVRRGDVAAAGHLLGRAYELRGPVEHGQHRGRELGYPTANLALPPAVLVPADGVYAGTLEWPGQAEGRAGGEPAAISVGTNPTFAGTRRTVEAYVVDRTGLDLYDLPVLLRFTQRLRSMVSFSSVEDLCAQMAADVDSVRELGVRGRSGNATAPHAGRA